MSYPSLLGALLGLWPILSGNQLKPPEACTVLTLADVTSTLGAGFTLVPVTAGVNSSELSSCLYRKGAGNTVAMVIMPAPNGDSKAAVLERQELQGRSGRRVTPLPGVCEAAFTVVATPTNTILIAGKRGWQLDFQVAVNGKANAEAEQQLAKAACARLP